jgi:hypothetical protein
MNFPEFLEKVQFLIISLGAIYPCEPPSRVLIVTELNRNGMTVYSVVADRERTVSPGNQDATAGLLCR